MYETTRLAIALRMARAVTQMTQKEMADALGVTKTVIARNEKPDMAMRADTLVRLVYVMNEQGVTVDVFSTLDTVRLYIVGDKLEAAAMRATRAALNLSQQDFADRMGLTKAVVARGERPSSTMSANTLMSMSNTLYSMGIKVDWVSLVKDMTVIVHRHAVEAIDQGIVLPGDPEGELVPIGLPEKLRGEAVGNHRVQKRGKDRKDKES